MQTFLAYADFDKSAQALDPSRLGNQVYRECKTLLSGGWKNHPASKMWQGYEHALCKYALACLKELSKRGRHYPHHFDFFINESAKYPNTGMPPWLGDEQFHAAHRSNLLRKANESFDKYRLLNDAGEVKKAQRYLSVYEWYKSFGWDENDDMEYVWPVR